ncbi:MAG TPA: 1,2-phenylacetyl-CoA epoxidase subunit PaaD [Micromonosporaceae bacterium]
MTGSDVVTGDRARAAAASVVDPEIPTLTIDDLGILRDVAVDGDTVRVSITPTYAGCPAMDVIRADLRRALSAAGFQKIEVETVLRPAWTTDWISESGRAKLAASGIAPPGPAQPAGFARGADAARRTGPVQLTLTVRCPRCGSPSTEQVSRFGSTACKSLWRCRACQEPFDHVKPL